MSYAVISNSRKRFFPFVGFSINSITLNSSKENTANILTNYLTNPPDQLAVKCTAGLIQIGFQCDLKNTGTDKTKLSVRLGYGIGGNSELHQRGSGTVLLGGPTINPCGLYGRFYCFLK